MKALRTARLAAWPQRNLFLIWSQVSYYYLRGYRRFKVTDIEEGRVLVGYETGLGQLKFRNEDIRTKFRTEMGRFMKMDVRPHVKRRGWGLSSMRYAAISQVALDYQLRSTNLDMLMSDFMASLLTFGVAALGHWQQTGLGGESESEIECIHPWELIPVPAYPIGTREVRAVQRYRKVPLKWLQAKAGEDGQLNVPIRKLDEKANILEIEHVEYGRHPNDEGLGADMIRAHGATESDETDYKSKRTQSAGNTEAFVPLTECWVLGPNHTVHEFIVIVGKHVALRKKLAGKGVPFPIGIAQHTPDLGFYSYGFVTKLISGNHQQEKMLQNLYRNVQELDQYGTVCWPLTAGLGGREFDKPGRPKRVTFEPDYSVPDVKPFTISPQNTGDFPGRVAAMADQFQDKQAGQGPMFSGQPIGRMESGSGVGFMFEVSQIAQAATAAQVANAWIQIYKSLLYTCGKTWDTAKALTLSNIDDNIAGVKIESDGTVTLADNPLPMPDEVDIDIRDRQPKSKEHRKQELLYMYESQIIDATELRIINYKENLELPVGNEAEFETYRKAVYQNIMLFNDGKTPGEIDYNMVTTNPRIWLRAVHNFTSRTEFMFASDQVRRAFGIMIKRVQSLMSGYPEQLPDMLQAMPGMGGAPGAGGPVGIGQAVPTPTAQPGVR